PDAGALARRFDGDRRPPICDDLDAWIANHDGLYYDLAELCRNHPPQLLAYADRARPAEAIEVLRAALRDAEIAARPEPWAKLATLLLASDALDDAQDA